MEHRLSLLQARVDRANKMLATLKLETERGCACVGDAFLDEILKHLFCERLIDERKVVGELMSFNNALGSHGTRLKLAYVLGWIGPKTYRDSVSIRKVRNEMAHNVDVDSFDHQNVSGIIDGLLSLKDISYRLAFRRDKFLCAVQHSVLQIWELLDESRHCLKGTDRPVVTLDPRQLTS